MTAPTTRAFRFCDSAELPEGALRSAVVGGRPVCVARQGGRLHAFGALCPHQQADLAQGILEAGALACGDHLWRFELETGRCTNIPGARLPLYDVREEGGAILVELDPR